MMNRFWSYQKLLLLSCNFQSKGSKANISALKFGLVFGGVGFLSAMLGYGNTTYLLLVCGLLLVNYIIKSEDKLFEIPPVSKLYFTVNVYLFTFMVMLFLAMVFLGVFSIFELITYTVPKLDFGITEILLGLIKGWKIVVILALVYVVIISIFIPTFFIKRKIIRRTIEILEYMVVYITLVAYKKNLPVVIEENRINLIKTLNAMTNADGMIVSLILISAIVLTISIWISYRLYVGKRC